jgi:tRNA G18 (ribose-2'-O)-methylase SpoU
MRKLSYEEIFNNRPNLDELAQQERFPFYCLVEDVRSLYNVGSVFRTSDAVKLNKLFLTGYTGFPSRREIDKTALGATESVPWQHYKQTDSAIKELKESNVKLIALEHTSKSVPYNEFDYDFPLCLILGNEVDGLSEETISQADYSVEIPMFGLKQSLNVSVAYGVVVFHIMQKYLEKYS